jgi:hypothetical protein
VEDGLVTSIIHSFVAEAAHKISAFITDSSAEPLDGDETERLGRLFVLELNLRQGNITSDEYEEAMKEMLR